MGYTASEKMLQRISGKLFFYNPRKSLYNGNVKNKI